MENSGIRLPELTLYLLICHQKYQSECSEITYLSKYRGRQCNTWNNDNGKEIHAFFKVLPGRMVKISFQGLRFFFQKQ